MRILPLMTAKFYSRKPTGGKKQFAEAIVGWDLRRSIGDFIRKVREWNSRDDTYVESLHDSDGNLLHECVEPLSQHRSHGSAKSGRRT